MLCVLLLSRNPWFRQSVENLLRREAEIEIAGQETEVDQAIKHLAELHPEAVIVDSAVTAHLSTATIAPILKTGAPIKVIRLNLEKNTLLIDCGERWVVKEAEDLGKVIKADFPPSVESAEQRLLQQVTAEPVYRLVLYKILKFCETPRLAANVENEIHSFPEMKLAIHTPNTLLRWLEEANGVERVVLENEVQCWQTTQTGKKVAAAQAPEIRLRELIAQTPAYHDIYIQVLQFCETPRTRTEIEKLLQGSPILEHPKVYPSFFIQNLESVGGLEWVGKWRTTEAGKGAAQ
jgi:hypothetical protein